MARVEPDVQDDEEPENDEGDDNDDDEMLDEDDEDQDGAFSADHSPSRPLAEPVSFRFLSGSYLNAYYVSILQLLMACRLVFPLNSTTTTPNLKMPMHLEERRLI